MSGQKVPGQKTDRLTKRVGGHNESDPNVSTDMKYGGGEYLIRIILKCIRADKIYFWEYVSS